MPDTIWVSPHPSLVADNRVALYEQHPDHPTADGWVMIDGKDAGPHEVAQTPGVLWALGPVSPHGGHEYQPTLIAAEAPAASKASTTTKAPASAAS